MPAPFIVSELPPEAFAQFPEPQQFMEYLRRVSKADFEGYLRQRFTEGIPYAFHAKPMLYEHLRSWLGRALSIHPKDITLIGSGRIGFSMAPTSYGRPYSSDSDLDLSIVSESLFLKLVADFEKWKSEYESGEVTASSANERFWAENFDRLPKNINRGFIDPYKIPSRYKSPREVGLQMLDLGRRLTQTTGNNFEKKVSVRVYRNWQAFSEQFLLNIKAIKL